MNQERPWSPSRWLLNLVMPGRYNDSFAIGPAQVLLTEHESKLLAKYAAAADHLVAPTPASFVDVNNSDKPRPPVVRSPTPARWMPPPTSNQAVGMPIPNGNANPNSTPSSNANSLRTGANPDATRAGLGVGPAPVPANAPARPPGNVGLGVVGVAVSGGTWSLGSRGPVSGTVGGPAGGDDAPAAPATPTKRRPKVLNKLSLATSLKVDGMMSPVPPSTPGSFFSESLMSPAAVPRYPHSKARPTLVTMERAAACALYFEQYYDALSRKNGPAIGGGRQRRGRASDKTFEFGRVIGQGAFGVVRIAKEKSNGRIVAIKQLRKIDLLRMGQEGHIRAEKHLLSAAATHNLGGPSWIPELYYSFQDQDHLYFALEFMGGGDLLTLLVSRGSLPEETVRFYAAEMILALHQTHTLGYIHRDVKPDNFLFTHDGHIRIADFGLATDLHWAHDSAYYEHQRRSVLKRHGVPLDRPAFGNRRRNVEGMQGGAQGAAGWGDKGKNLLTWRSKNRRRQAYTICGTNSYMAPEVIRGSGYGFGVDWWGLGVIIYEAIYGTIPFIGNSREHARKKILDWRNQLQFPRRGVSPLALDFMKRLLCDPEERLGYVSTGRRGSSASVTAGATASSTSIGNGNVSLLDGPLGHDGVEQLMAHPWFADVDWSQLQDVFPPFQPSLRSIDDTRHFDDDIPDEPLAPGNSALYLRDPLLGDKACGKEVLGIRKELAFKGWTFRSKIDELRPGRHPSGASTHGITRGNSLRDPRDRVPYSPSPHRARHDASATLRAPVHEATMMTLCGPPNNDSDSEYSDDDMDTEVGWSTDDIDVDGGDIVDAPEPETPEIEMDEDDNGIGDVVDSYLDGPNHQYGYARHPRRFYPRGYDVYPRYQPHTNSFERAYDDHWWETQQLDLREMLSLGNPEDYERPSCVPTASSTSPNSSPARTVASPSSASTAVATSPVLGGPVRRSKTKLLPSPRNKNDVDSEQPTSPTSALVRGRERAQSMPPVNLVSLRA